MQKPHLAVMFVFGACTSSGGGGGGEGTSTSEIRGDAVYRDAATDHAGQAQQAAAPAQSATLSIVMHGSGQFSVADLDPRCALDPAGQFEAVVSGTVDLASGSAYVAALASGSGHVTSASGCELPSLSVMVVTDAKLRAEITATAESCRPYCAASARADAEAQCGGSASAAECRAAAESDLAASCTTSCTTQAHSIVAETSLATGQFAGLDLTAVKAADVGDIDADLTSDHVEQ